MKKSVKPCGAGLFSDMVRRLYHVKTDICRREWRQNGDN